MKICEGYMFYWEVSMIQKNLGIKNDDEVNEICERYNLGKALTISTLVNLGT